jgi:hypothetical protein
MTTDNWLTVAIIASTIMVAAATLLAPTLAVIVQVRMSQPKQIPQTKRGKRFGHKIGYFIGYHMTRHVGRMFVTSVACNSLMLVIVLLRYRVMTRWAVALISLMVAVLVFQPVLYFTLATFVVFSLWIVEIRGILGLPAP